MNTTAPYIAIAGSIAVGKSTLAKNLGKRLGLSYILEPYEGNPFVKLSYENPKKWSFRSQMFFLAETARAHQTEILNSPATVVAERSIYEHFEIFASLHKESMSDDEYLLLEKVYQTIRMLLRPPDLLLYLYADEKIALENIKKRGRPFEKDLLEKDLQELGDLYQDFAEGWTLSPVVEWNSGKNDLRQQDNLEGLVSLIKKEVDLSTVVI